MLWCNDTSYNGDRDGHMPDKCHTQSTCVRNGKKVKSDTPATRMCCCCRVWLHHSEVPSQSQGSWLQGIRRLRQLASPNPVSIIQHHSSTHFNSRWCCSNVTNPIWTSSIQITSFRSGMVVVVRSWFNGCRSTCCLVFCF